jgi:TnpA family transposase
MEKDIGRLTKNPTTEVVIRIDDFGGKPGLTIREFVTSDRYTGFTKSGVRISSDDFKKFKEMINSINEKDLESTGEPEEKPAKKAKT